MLGELPKMVSELPTQFNEVTNKTIELIDVLWLKGNSIVAAFEVESTTAIYSGLLRMSDLLALQPNLEINLFLVAPTNTATKSNKKYCARHFRCATNHWHESAGSLDSAFCFGSSKAFECLDLKVLSNRSSCKKWLNFSLRTRNQRKRSWWFWILSQKPGSFCDIQCATLRS